MLAGKSLQRIFVFAAASICAALLLVTLFVLTHNSSAQNEGQAAAVGVTFPLMVGTSLNPVGTNHDLFAIDVATGVSQTISTTFPVWGATYDAANDRVLFTSSAGSSNGDQLWEWPVGGTLNNLGTIMDTSGARRIDGLALSGGVLYGAVAEVTPADGIWIIDTTTLMATKVLTTSDSISGIDADPNTGEVYGLNDTTGNLVLIDVAGDTITPVAPYPVGETDIDGLAISDDGRAYLVTDEPGSIYVYNLTIDAYEAPLTAPWTGADTFSGAAFVYLQASIAIEKSPDNQTVFSGGDALFTITVSNTSILTLTNVIVSDAMAPKCHRSLGTMAPGSSTSYGCTDAGVTESYTNTAEVFGLAAGSIPVTAMDRATVTVVAAPMPAIEVTKTVGTEPSSCATTDAIDLTSAGGEVTYCYTVQNTGNVTFTTHDVVDDRLGALQTDYLFDLGPGETTFFTATTTVTQSVTNVVTWTASITGTPSVFAVGTATATVMVEPTPGWLPVFFRR